MTTVYQITSTIVLELSAVRTFLLMEAGDRDRLRKVYGDGLPFRKPISYRDYL